MGDKYAVIWIDTQSIPAANFYFSFTDEAMNKHGGHPKPKPKPKPRPK